MTPPPVVDAHHHVWDLAVRDQDWITGEELAPLRRTFTLADLEPEARAAGVVSTVLVQTVTVAEETPSSSPSPTPAHSSRASSAGPISPPRTSPAPSPRSVPCPAATGSSESGTRSRANPTRSGCCAPTSCAVWRPSPPPASSTT